MRDHLELRTGERFLRVHVELDHHVRDHRLRAHFPLPAPVDGSDAECAFAVVHRGLTAEGGPHEHGLPDLRVPPLRRLLRRRRRARAAPRRAARVRGGRRRPRARTHAAARHRLPVALRAVAAPEPRGPARPARGTPAAGPARARLRGAPPPRRLVHARRFAAAADEFLLPLERVRGGGWLGATVAPDRRPALHVDGAEVSALHRDDAGALDLAVGEPARRRPRRDRGAATAHRLGASGRSRRRGRSRVHRGE